MGVPIFCICFGYHCNVYKHELFCILKLCEVGWQAKINAKKLRKYYVSEEFIHVPRFVCFISKWIISINIWLFTAYPMLRFLLDH